MRITADTNVLLSSAFWYGDSFKIIEKAENKEIDLVLSDDIINEFKEVLEYEEIKEKIKDKNLEMKRTVEKIREISQIVNPKETLDVIKEDPDDNRILECAVEGKADYIITQDNHLLKLKEFKDIKILTPSDFLEEIKKTEEILNDKDMMEQIEESEENIKKGKIKEFNYKSTK